MSLFPSNPENLQIATINGVVYEYSASKDAWRRIGATNFTANAVNLSNTTDSSDSLSGALVVSGGVGISGNVNIAESVTVGNIFPITDQIGDIGSPNRRWRDIYLSENTIYFGNIAFSSNSVLPFDLSISPEVLAIQVAAPGPGDDTTWLWTWEQSTLPYARTTITNSPQISVPLYRQGTYQVNNFANEITGQMDQQHLLYLKWIDGAGLDNLVDWAVNTGNVDMSHPDINNGVTTTVQRTNISVPATVTLPTLVAPAISYNVSFANVGAYTFTGNGIGDNRTLGPFYRGGTYTFNLDVSIQTHPFYLTADNGTNFSANTYFGEYTSGVTGSRNNGSAGQETLVFIVPQNAPSVLYYQCAVHTSMRGVIVIKDLAVETNINGNYVLYFQHTKEGHKTAVEIRPIPSLVNQMCLVYDASVGQFVPQDMATYVENTPSFKNKIQEVAGTATLVAPDGVAVVPTVNIVEDATYLPLVGNKDGDITYAEDTNVLYIWNNNSWNDVSGEAQTPAASPRYINLSISGEIISPRTGQSRFYPPESITIDRIYASISQAATGGPFTFMINKNGVDIGTVFSITENSFVMSPIDISISLTTADYLTINVTGVDSRDFQIRMRYTGQ